MPYETARHPALLCSEKALLVVVDMQEPFLRHIWERERVVRNVGLLVESARILSLPVIVTQQNTARMGETIPEIAAPLALLPKGCALLEKMCFSCCGAEAFREAVRSAERSQILVCGVEAHICVCQTALDLTEQGYQVHVAADAVSSRAAHNVEIGLKKAERAGAYLSSVEMALYELLGEAGTPAFKQALALLK